MLNHVKFAPVAMCLIFIASDLCTANLNQQQETSPKFAAILSELPERSAENVQQANKESVQNNTTHTKSSKSNGGNDLFASNTHESSSPSTISSFYDYLNNKQPLRQQRNNPRSQVPSNGYPTMTIAEENGAQAANYIGQTVALGSESGSSLIGGPLVFTSGSLMNSNSMLNQPALSMQPVSNGDQDQVLASFYINSLGNQQQPIGMAQISPLTQGRVHQVVGPAASQVYGARQPERTPYVGYSNHFGINQQPIMNPFGDATRKRTKARVQLPSNDAISNRTPPSKHKPGNQVTVKGNKRNENMLSNAQLISLIDELKDFNSRQASKTISRDSPSPQPNKSRLRKEKKSIEEEDADEEPNSMSESESSRDKASHAEGDQDGKTKDSEQAEKLNPEDLARFAKFLMSKEGSNLKFQLGLEKDSPDDGDEEDDKDSLLESKKNPTKTQLTKRKELKDLDNKHSEVASHLDKLINDLTSSTKNAEEATDNKRKKIRKKMNKRRDEDEFDKARKRRDHHSQAAELLPDDGEPSLREEVSANVPLIEVEKSKVMDIKRPLERSKFEKGHSNNFAKMLMKQELLEDEKDSDKPTKTAASTTKNEHKTHEQGSTPKESNDHQVVTNNRILGSDIPSDKNKREGVEQEIRKEEEADRPLRKEDHTALISHELEKVRKNKAETRFNRALPLPVDSLVKRTLDGEMSLNAEHNPGGKLLLSANGETAMVLKLPKSSKKRVFYNDFEAQNNTDLVASTLDPSKESKIVYQSEKPLKDEYPISERVSDRLNKLSQNLDQYFNDGFIQEIESKARPVGKEQTQAQENQPQLQSTNVNESPQSSQGDGNSSIDHDFDIDVGIDGKRDIDHDDGDDDNSEELKNKRRVAIPRRSVERGAGTRTRSINEQLGHRSYPKQNNNKVQFRMRRPMNNQNGVIRRVKIVIKPTDGVGGMGIDASSERQRELVSQDKVTHSLDPVESESLETPIGPDSEFAGSAAIPKRRRRVSKERNRSSNGKNKGSKFYEEPEWSSR